MSDPALRDYYAARADEYDDWYLRLGRYSHGPDADAVWNSELASRRLCGWPSCPSTATSWSSPRAQAGGRRCSLGAASCRSTTRNPEPLAIATDRLAGAGLTAKIEVRDAWAQPDRQVDALFMGFWLSHVPRARLGEFLTICRAWLKPGGILAFIDSRLDPESSATNHPTPADDLSMRRLNDGREFTITKIYWVPLEMEAALAAAGFRRRGSPAISALLPLGPRRRPPFRLRAMSLNGKRIATVGSGVMAEAMIAGLLRGEQVAPDQIVASHPRADRRNELVGSYGIGTVEDNVSAVTNADVIVLAIKPQMLVRVGRELRGHLTDGQLVISIIAGATSTALTNALGHRQIVRSMPNTPAQLGKGMTVWYATPEVTRRSAIKRASCWAVSGSSSRSTTRSS